MKNAICYIGILVIIVFIAGLGIKGLTRVANSANRVAQEEFTEWVSPDGVHYWYGKEINGYSWFAPRYDNNGNLVIDKQN